MLPGPGDTAASSPGLSGGQTAPGRAGMPGCGFRKDPCTPLLPEPPHIQMLMGSPFSPSPRRRRGCFFPSSPSAVGLGPVRGASPLAPTRRPWEEGSPLLAKEGGTGTGFIRRWQLAAMNDAVKNGGRWRILCSGCCKKQPHGCGGDKAACQCCRGQGWKFSMLIPPLPASPGPAKVNRRSRREQGKVHESHAFCAGRNISQGPDHSTRSPPRCRLFGSFNPREH